MKRLVVRLGMIMVWLFIVCAVGWAESKWYPGIIHAHSLFSDGARTPEQLVFYILFSREKSIIK